MATIVVNYSDFFSADLRKQFGILWSVFDIAGIPVFDQRHEKGLKCVLFRLCYPFLLHCNLLYCVYSTISHGKLNYSAVIDVILPFLACIMWMMMYKRRISLKAFLTDLAHASSKYSTLQNRRLTYGINVAMCSLFIYPPLLNVMKFLQVGEIRVDEIFRNLQEIVFPCLVAITYSSICYLLLQNLRSCKNMLQKKLDLSCSGTVEILKQNYLEAIRSVEAFEELFSNPILIFVFNDFCIVSLITMDIMYDQNWMMEFLLESPAYLIFILGILGFLTICAADISLEMLSIKSVLLEKMFAHPHQDAFPYNEKQIDLLLKKDACVLTAGKAFPFDRGFLLKALAAVIAQAVVIYQLGSSLNQSDHREEESEVSLRSLINYRSAAYRGHSNYKPQRNHNMTPYWFSLQTCVESFLLQTITRRHY
ncbi:hypothetical protein AVEN_44544-1 [Araneus ventricosus]|uniref:Uncharacterized protein n=1 Tax=Araneus ventricosus TaxID=182803 RepID=A0A4Y2FAX8_ARAVE|nr:hypothetical protein AVEN_44544-1 [Araneus ventricosus]